MAPVQAACSMARLEMVRGPWLVWMRPGRRFCRAWRLVCIMTTVPDPPRRGVGCDDVLGHSLGGVSENECYV